MKKQSNLSRLPVIWCAWQRMFIEGEEARFTATRKRKNYHLSEKKQRQRECPSQQIQKRVARLVSEEASIRYLTDSLRGVLKNSYSDVNVREARTEKYNSGE